jgi:hypothetical protein
MTARKRFKRLVRARAAKTGESYTAALRNFATTSAKEHRMPRSMFEEALESAGVRHDTLTNAERLALARDGYVIMEGLLSPDQLDAARERFEALVAAPTPGVGQLEEGVRRGFASVDDEVFVVCTMHPRLLAAAAHVLGTPFFAGPGVGLRDPLPGHGGQALHQDVGPLVPLDFHPHRVAAQWFLDAVDEHNGAPRVVPGSHLMHPGDFYRPGDPRLAYHDGVPHPNEQVLSAPSGSLLIRNANLWHAGTRNDSRSSRRSVQQGFSTWDDSTGNDLRIDYHNPPESKNLLDLLVRV